MVFNFEHLKHFNLKGQKKNSPPLTCLYIELEKSNRTGKKEMVWGVF